MAMGWISFCSFGCEGKKDASGPAGSAESAAPSTTGAAEADVNAAVPDALKPKLKFVMGNLEDGRNKAPALVPEGWEQSSVIPGKFKPKGDARLGFMTGYDLGTNCDGMCTAKDWAAVSESVDFAQFKDPKFTIVKDEKKPGFRLLIATAKDGPTYLRAAMWKEGASRYFTCGATLESEIAAALPAFEKACRAFSPGSW